MKSSIILTAALLFLFFSSPAQQPFSARGFVDVNNINSSVMVHGDMNWNPYTSTSECEFPKGSGIHVASATTIWMAGYDSQGQLYVSAQTYRQTGNDFWPGPLDNTGPVSFATSEKWARVWKVDFNDINNHLSNSTHTATNTSKDIWEWPAKGNPHAKGNNGAALTITTQMAPYRDVNSDGKYNAADGDYPLIKGDQMLWWVFNDNGPTHNNGTSTPPLGVEVQAIAYAYKRGTLLDNVVFYEMDIANKSSDTYLAYRVGINADMDLGFYGDDYMGFDSSRKLGYVYNGDPMDGSGQPDAYGVAPPIAGYKILQMPGENLVHPRPAGSFIVYHNDGTVIGNPQNGREFSNYLRSQVRNDDYLKNDYSGFGKITNGTGAGPITRYSFPGKPADTFQWSECSSLNPSGDRRFVLATDDHALISGDRSRFSFALVIADTGRNNTCPDVDIAKIQKVADTAQQNYKTPPKSFVSVIALAQGKALGLFPNPAKDILYISAPFDINEQGYALTVYDMSGRKTRATYKYVDNRIEVNTGNLPPGVYHVVYTDEDVKQAATFVKE